MVGTPAQNAVALMPFSTACPGIGFDGKSVETTCSSDGSMSVLPTPVAPRIE